MATEGLDNIHQGVAPSIQEERLVESMDRAIRDALIHRGVYSLSGYAWQDENTPSSDFIGLAKWETESPELSLGLYHSALSEEEREKLRALEAAGEDLWALMEMTRAVIGHAIVYSGPAKKSAMTLDAPFWTHYLNAMTLLSIAADRMREMFLLGFFKQTFREYTKGKPDQARYFDYPYTDAMRHPSASAFQNELTTLAGLAKRIFDEGISKRNELVHELATKSGKLAKATAGTALDRLNEDACPFEDLQKAWEGTRSQHESEIESAVQSLIDWYGRLVQAISLVCDIEHTLRRSIRLRG